MSHATINWTQDPPLPYTHTVTDEVETYYCDAPGVSVQYIADDFIRGYQTRDEGVLAAEAVTFTVGTVSSAQAAMFKGFPGKGAFLVGYPLRTQPAR